MFQPPRKTLVSWEYHPKYMVWNTELKPPTRSSLATHYIPMISPCSTLIPMKSIRSQVTTSGPDKATRWKSGPNPASPIRGTGRCKSRPRARGGIHLCLSERGVVSSEDCTAEKCGPGSDGFNELILVPKSLVSPHRLLACLDMCFFLACFFKPITIWWFNIAMENHHV